MLSDMRAIRLPEAGSFRSAAIMACADLDVGARHERFKGPRSASKCPLAMNGA
jgi:hypothetical protein